MNDTATATHDEPVRLRDEAMIAADAAYMKGDGAPVAGSIPMSTSRYLNSPLFSHAYTTLALRRFGHDIPVTYDIPDMQRGIEDVADLKNTVRLIAEEREKKPEFAAWLDRRTYTSWKAEEMVHYADGTLGAEIRDFITKSGMDIEFAYKGKEVASDIEYLFKRASQSHDIQHMVTRFGPNIAGETAMAMMNVTCDANYFSPELAHALYTGTLFVSSASYMRAGLHYPAGMPILLEAMERGIAAGRAIRKPLLMIDWEDYLDWQIADIAPDLGFEPGPGDAWVAFDRVLLG
jgi:ubiquinone biosynthesis protein COQ4